MASQVATIFENMRLRGSKMELLIKKYLGLSVAKYLFDIW